VNKSQEVTSQPQETTRQLYIGIWCSQHCPERTQQKIVILLLHPRTVRCENKERKKQAGRKTPFLRSSLKSGSKKTVYRLLEPAPCQAVSACARTERCERGDGAERKRQRFRRAQQRRDKWRCAGTGWSLCERKAHVDLTRQKRTRPIKSGQSEKKRKCYPHPHPSSRSTSFLYKVMRT